MPVDDARAEQQTKNLAIACSVMALAWLMFFIIFGYGFNLVLALLSAGSALGSGLKWRRLKRRGSLA